MAEKNNKRVGRRFAIGGSAIALLAGFLIYIIETFKHNIELLQIGKDLYGNFSGDVMLITGFVAGALTITDAILKKNK